MIRIEKINDCFEMGIKGDSTFITVELHVILKHILNCFYEHNQEQLILEEITDVVNEFVEEHTIKSKRRRRK